ncbi:PfkB family carbohydrate kinase [Micromonospora sp. NPDC005222]|uniref:PfkB family carbohydrate kinase n=2 Tax=Micromonospora TaxID=1873 RepID=UPI0033AA4572
MRGPLVVLGDTLLDRDVEGLVNRLCPDSPVPVLDETVSLDRPGGAGLAAVFAAAQGAEVALVTAVADDAGGARLGTLLAAAGVRLYALPLAGATPEKIRLRARGRVLLRHDRGGGSAGAPGQPSDAVLRLIADASAVLVSDYGRGVAGHPALRAALAATRAPVVWDPHPRGPAAVPGVHLATPNEPEARELAKTPPGGSRLAVASRSAHALRRRWQARAVAVTLGGDGALLSHAGATPLVVPAPPAEGDTCGAGDRFASTATLALARGALVSEAVQEAVAEASAYVAGGGVATALPAPVRAVAPAVVTGGGDRIGAGAAGEVVARVRAAGGTVVATGGCFDLLHAGHVATLQAARQLGDCLVVCLNSDASVAGLKGPGRPVVPHGDRGRLLAALGCVDAVLIFDEPTPEAALSWLRPDIWVKGGDYASGGGPETLPETEILARWGGHTVVVPYLDGRSTTDMIAAARAGRGSGRPAGSVDPAEAVAPGRSTAKGTR